MEITLKEVEVQKLNVMPGDVLIFKFKGEIDEYQMKAFGAQLRKLFPDNKVVVLGLDDDQDIELTVLENRVSIASTDQPGQADCAVPTSYCDSCACGKKERILAEQGKKE